MYKIGIGLDTLLNSNLCDLISLQYLYLFKISYWAEVVTSPRRSITATSELTSDGCNFTRLASDHGWACQKVRLYSTFGSGLRHLPPRMKNQHGLNEEKTFIGKKSLNWVLVMWPVWLVWILTTKRKSLKWLENFERYVTFSCCYSLIVLIKCFFCFFVFTHYLDLFFKRFYSPDIFPLQLVPHWTLIVHLSLNDVMF
jgi:hypothetical protein